MPKYLHVAVYDTPFGDLAVFVAPEDGAVVCSTFRPMPDAAQALPAALAARGLIEARDASVTAAVDAWLSGDGSLLTTIPVRQHGSPFFTDVWDAVRQIPSGETASYAEIAHMAGRPRAARAAGTACGRNQTAPFVPCHRVVASHGIGSYGFGGAEVKAAMLELEGARVPS